MYHDYFGLKEHAFSIAVNPRYLYMSKQHRDALAHLLYGVQGGGFVLLSGEVGTGKTTIIRCLLEQLPENTDIAIVLNPMATAIEILGSMCDELGVKYHSDRPTVKSIMDALQGFLIENHTRGHNTVLLIDEAQLLSPEVLEQIRLLTNLETTTKKLLQIILVGQPELNELLSQPRLRQLSQRITARFHLKPLSLEETLSYIHHRLQVAGMPEDRNPFTPRIIKRIHDFTGGIPRLINILCERTLVGAYGNNKHQVDTAIFLSAQKEVSGSDAMPKKETYKKYWTLISAAIAGGVGVFLLFLVVFVMSNFANRSAPSDYELLPETVSTELAPTTLAPKIPAVPKPSAETALQVTESVTPIEPVAVNPQATVPIVEGNIEIKSYNRAQELLLTYLKYPVASETHPCWQLSRKEVKCQESKLRTWNNLSDLNRPAILTLTTPEKFVAYAVLIGLTDTDALLLTETNQQKVVSLSELGPSWTGEVFYIWHKPRGFSEPLNVGSQGRTVRWVAEQFATLDNQPKPLTKSKFNDALKERIKFFQRSQGLEADGILGSNTLLKLNEVLGLDAVLERELHSEQSSNL